MVMIPQRNSPRYESDDDKLTAHFTPGQLVIYVCVSLFVLLVFFLLGVLVGKYDRSIGDATPSAEGTVVAGAQGTQTSPRVPEPVMLPPEPVQDSDTRPPDIPSVDLPPLPAVAEDAAPIAPEAAPETAGPLEEQSPRTTAEPVAAATSAPPEPPAGTPPLLTPVEPPPEQTAAPSAPVPPPSETPPPSPPPVAENASAASAQTPPKPAPGSFGVQVVSLVGDRRREGADACQRKLKELGWESVVLEYNSGRSYAVVVVGFADRAAAIAARDKLRLQKEFKDCFVKQLP